jgi:hypothetical protein
MYVQGGLFFDVIELGVILEFWKESAIGRAVVVMIFFFFPLGLGGRLFGSATQEKRR